LTAVQRTEEPVSGWFCGLKGKAIPWCPADRHANFAPALIAQYEYQHGMARSAASSRLTERHLCLTGNGLRQRCKPVVGSCQRQCPGTSGLSAVGQFRHRGRLPDPSTANTIILRAHGSKFSERCRSFFRSKPDARIRFGLAKRPHALERAITRNTAAFLVEPIQGEGGIIAPPAGYGPV
jgi:hypothetical protein